MGVSCAGLCCTLRGLIVVTAPRPSGWKARREDNQPADTVIGTAGPPTALLQTTDTTAVKRRLTDSPFIAAAADWR